MQERQNRILVGLAVSAAGFVLAVVGMKKK